MRTEPTREMLTSEVFYDPETGLFTRLYQRGRSAPGDNCETVRGMGYRSLNVFCWKWASHRMAWTYTYGSIPQGMQIDHINGIRTDNRIANLRLATLAENRRNRICIGKLGKKGVTLTASRCRYRSRIAVNGQRHHLGYFDTPEEANAAYAVAARRLHGEFARL